MTRLRLAAVLGLAAAALTGCREQTVSGPAGPVLTGPIGAASAVPASQTICSDSIAPLPDDPNHFPRSNVELSYDGVTWIKGFWTDPFPAYGPAIPGSKWIGPYNRSGANTDIPPGTYHFRTSFTIPANATSLSLNGLVHADNMATIWLNGTQIFKNPAEITWEAFQGPPEPFSGDRYVTLGTNAVAIDLLNADDGSGAASVTALDFCVTASYKIPAPPPPPDTTGGGGGGGSGGGVTKPCPAAQDWANQYLQELGIKSNSNQYKTIISAVKDHTAQSATFEGIDKCDTRFREAVRAYIRTLLHITLPL